MRFAKGGPVSPYFFLLRLEILGIMIYIKNRQITGIHVNDKEHKIAQFADDVRG